LPEEDRVVVLDTDFLSSFLKIGKLTLIRDFFGVGKLYIPAAVLGEIAKTKLAKELLNNSYIQIKNVDENSLRGFGKHFENLGRGEKECIVLCKQFQNSLLLISDKKALDVAKRNQITVLNIPAFLFACKSTEFLNSEELSQIIKDLKQKDYYEFSNEEKELLV
jgi:predicted nucleic acid-binding protein